MDEICTKTKRKNELRYDTRTMMDGRLKIFLANNKNEYNLCISKGIILLTHENDSLKSSDI